MVTIFNNIENQTDLISLVVKVHEKEWNKKFLVPLIFSDGKKLEATKDSLKIIFNCNKEETNTRLVLHNYLQDMNIIVVSKDTDFGTANRQSWRTRINHEKFEDVSKVHTFPGEKP